MVNGTYWAGALLGTLGTLIFLNQLVPSSAGASRFLIGPVLGIVILFVRRHLPESPRWQVMNGREKEAEESISYIEHEVEQSGRNCRRSTRARPSSSSRPRTSATWRSPGCSSASTRRGSILGATLMITQSFLYNAIFFTYTLVLGKFYGVAPENAPLFLIAFAVGNLAGPLTLGHLFDTIGRRKMIAGTYVLSGVLLAITAFLFNAGVLNAVTQTIAWCIIFFFASAGASAGVPDGQRDLPAGGAGEGDRGVLRHRPVLRRDRPGDLRRADRRRLAARELFFGYLLGAGVMIVGGLVAVFLAVDAEGKSLEDIATPLAVRRHRYPRRGGGPVRHDSSSPPLASRRSTSTQVGRGSRVPAASTNRCQRPAPLPALSRSCCLRRRRQAETARSAGGLPAADVVAGGSRRCGPSARTRVPIAGWHRRDGRAQLRPPPARALLDLGRVAELRGVERRGGRSGSARACPTAAIIERARRSCPAWRWPRAPSAPRRSASAAPSAATSARRRRPVTRTRRCWPPAPWSRSRRPRAAPARSRPRSSTPA